MSCVCCLQFPDWSYLEDNSSYDNSWCDDRIFNLAFVLSGGSGVVGWGLDMEEILPGCVVLQSNAPASRRT